MAYFAYWNGYIVTANANGDIPLSSKIVAFIGSADHSDKLIAELIEQANDTARQYAQMRDK